MKILLVQDYLRSGGTERQTVLYANAFAAAGHEVTLFTFRPGGPLAPTLSPAVRHQALQTFDTRFDWFAPRLSRHLAAADPHIVLCMGRMANCYGRRIRRVLRRRHPCPLVICTMRTGKTLPRLFLLSLRSADHVIANSRAARETLTHRYRLPPARITVIPNAMVFPVHGGERERLGEYRHDCERWESDPTALRAQHGANDRTRVLLDVAMFRPGKNQRELIAIVAGLPASFPWRLWLAGDGPARADCERFARECGVADRVLFFGRVDDPSALYAAADLAVHASHRESLSNFLIEAQARGLPVVAYAAQGVEECFLPGVTGQALPFGSQEAFRTAILRFSADDPALRDRARDFARTRFDPVRQVQAHLDLFQALVSQQS